MTGLFNARRLPVLVMGNILGVLGLLWASGTIPPVSRSGPPMLLIAHRGDTHDHAENSLGAIVSARNGGFDGIEFDTQQSADGTWWLFHDDTVDRLTDRTGAFGGLSDAEIGSLTIGGHGEPLVQLETVIRELAGYGGWVYLDVKATDPSLALGAVAAAHDLPHLRVIVRNAAVACELRSHYPQLETAALSHVVEHDDQACVSVWLANQIELSRPGTVAGRQRSVDAFVDLGTANLGGILDRLSRFGVRAAIAERPQ